MAKHKSHYGSLSAKSSAKSLKIRQTRHSYRPRSLYYSKHISCRGTTIHRPSLGYRFGVHFGCAALQHPPILDISCEDMRYCSLVPWCAEHAIASCCVLYASPPCCGSHSSTRNLLPAAAAGAGTALTAMMSACVTQIPCYTSVKISRFVWCYPFAIRLFVGFDRFTERKR